MKNKILTAVIIIIILAFIGAAVLWLRSRFTKDPTLNVASSGISEAGGPEE